MSVTLLTAVMIFCNYHFGVDKWINHHDSLLLRFGYRYIVSLAAFGIPYLFYHIKKPTRYFSNSLFLLMLFIAPAIFSLKMAMISNFSLSADAHWNHYWNRILYWPLRLLITAALLFAIWKKYYRTETFFGLTVKKFNWKPYAWMLVFMLPLIAAASTQPDFLHVYPKLKMVTEDISYVPNSWFYKLLFELSYGSDFISIELFFRGFLILAFVKWAGKDAILPMACFYCTIHFGKPLGECISSYFGGILLGIVVYHTRSIFGGLVVHLGIAWLMEIGGYAGGVMH
ncbi:MAG: CPBP family glutamic-type intramembrane protease [Bacteroidota bacterium]